MHLCVAGSVAAEWVLLSFLQNTDEFESRTVSRALSALPEPSPPTAPWIRPLRTRGEPIPVFCIF